MWILRAILAINGMWVIVISKFISISYIKTNKQHDIEDMLQRPERPETILTLTKVATKYAKTYKKNLCVVIDIVFLIGI